MSKQDAADAADAAALGPTSAAVRRLRNLVAKRSARDDAGLVVVEGVRAVTAALEAGAPVREVFAEPEVPGGLLHAARVRGVRVTPLRAGVADRVADTVTPQGVLAVVPAPHHDLRTVDLANLTVVLTDLRDPGNAGTLVRAAEGAGASAVVFCRGSVDPFSPKVVRAAAGAAFYIPVVRGGDPGEVLDVLAQRGLRRLGTAAEGGEPYDRVDWTVPSALILGNEAWGIPDDAARHVDAWVSIPMQGRSESLNVAMAGSILLFEAARHQRDAGG